MLLVPISSPSRVAIRVAPCSSCTNAKRGLDEGKNYDSFKLQKSQVWLLTSNLIAPNKVGATAPIFLDSAPYIAKSLIAFPFATGLRATHTGTFLLYPVVVRLLSSRANPTILYEQVQGPCEHIDIKPKGSCLP